MPSSPRVAFLFFKLGVLKSQVAIGNLRLDLSAPAVTSMPHSFLPLGLKDAILGGAADHWEIPKVRNLMGALWIPISLVLGYSEQFSESL